MVYFSFRLPKALPLGYELIAPTGRCFFVSFTQGVAIGLCADCLYEAWLVYSFRLPQALPLGYVLIAPSGRGLLFVSFTPGVAIGL